MMHRTFCSGFHYPRLFKRHGPCARGLILLFCLLQLQSCQSLNEPRPQTIESWNALKWKNVHRQQLDFSCGAGALSTLIEYYFQDPAPEMFILEDLFNRLGEETLQDRKKGGFSMNDLKIQAEAMGYIAAGIAMTPQMARDLKGPVIVLLEGKELNHFVILKGIAGGKAYLADPARGNIQINDFDFFAQWNSLALVLGKKGFGLPTDHLLSIAQECSADWRDPQRDNIQSNYRQFQNIPDRFFKMRFPVREVPR